MAACEKGFCTTPIAVGTGTSAEVDSEWDLPDNAVLDDAYVEVIAAEATGATKTLDVGLLSSESGGDADGFLAGIDVSTTGIKRGSFTATDGSNQNYFSASTVGVLMREGLLGGDRPSAAGGGGAHAIRTR